MIDYPMAVPRRISDGEFVAALLRRPSSAAASSNAMPERPPVARDTQTTMLEQSEEERSQDATPGWEQGLREMWTERANGRIAVGALALSQVDRHSRDWMRRLVYGARQGEHYVPWFMAHPTIRARARNAYYALRQEVTADGEAGRTVLVSGTRGQCKERRLKEVVLTGRAVWVGDWRRTYCHTMDEVQTLLEVTRDQYRLRLACRKVCRHLKGDSEDLLPLAVEWRDYLLLHAYRTANLGLMRAKAAQVFQGVGRDQRAFFGLIVAMVNLWGATSAREAYWVRSDEYDAVFGWGASRGVQRHRSDVTHSSPYGALPSGRGLCYLNSALWGWAALREAIGGQGKGRATLWDKVADAINRRDDEMLRTSYAELTGTGWDEGGDAAFVFAQWWGRVYRERWRRHDLLAGRVCLIHGGTCDGGPRG